jgi:tetratricopeptide (TPR) repeat protein
MRILACILVLLAARPSFAQQSSNSGQSQSQSQSQSQDQSQPQTQSADKPAERKRLPLGKQPATADENPFPEDISKKAAADAGNPAPDAPTAAPSSQPAAKSDKPPAGDSQPGYSSSRTKFAGVDVTADNENRISDGAGGYIHNPKLAADDVRIGGFYLKNGDFKGAYARFKEATLVDTENADAVFGLAEAARGLKLTNEAADNYRIYLDADPDGPKAKVARKALAELGTPPKK